MEKRTLIALVAFVVIGGAAFYALRAPEKGQRSGPPPRPFAEIKADQVQEIDLTSEKQDHTTLVKKGGGWRIKSPEDWGADATAAKQLVDAIAGVTFGDIATEDAAKQADLGVADGKAPRVTAKGDGGKVLADFYVGKPVGGFTMLRPAGKNEIWQASKIFPYMVNRDTKQWRDHTIFELPVADIDKLTVDAGADKLVLEKEAPAKDAKPGEPAKWKIAQSTGAAPKTSDVLDLAQVTGAVQTLSNLRAADFADDKKPEETQLDKPWLTVTVHAKDKDHSLFLGAAKNDDVFVRSSDAPTAYVVKKYGVDRIAHKPADYRDKTIVKIKADDLAGVDLTVGAETTALENAGGKWKARGKTAVDEGKVKAVVASFENFAGAGFADEKDLGKPLGQVVLHTKDGKATTLKIGPVTKDGDYRVQKVGAPDIYVVKKFSVDRFFKKPSELAPGAPAPAPPVPAPKKK